MSVCTRHVLPPLPYDVAALAPHIAAQTMQLHHGVHHAAYVRALNVALASAPHLQDKTARWLLLNLDKIPESIVTAVRNNAGGHVNHSLLWRAMSPQGGGAPVGPLADAIDDAFGSLGGFKNRFEEAGSKLFASGWVWLVKSQHDADKIQVLTTSGHASPMAQGYVPLLVNDVWEHAYYLEHQNRRMEYLKGWWPVVNWSEAAHRYARSRHPAAQVAATAGNGAAPPATRV